MAAKKSVEELRAGNRERQARWRKAHRWLGEERRLALYGQSQAQKKLATASPVTHNVTDANYERGVSGDLEEVEAATGKVEQRAEAARGRTGSVGERAGPSWDSDRLEERGTQDGRRGEDTIGMEETYGPLEGVDVGYREVERKRSMVPRQIAPNEEGGERLERGNNERTGGGAGEAGVGTGEIAARTSGVDPAAGGSAEERQALAWIAAKQKERGVQVELVV